VSRSRDLGLHQSRRGGARRFRIQKRGDGECRRTDGGRVLSQARSLQPLIPLAIDTHRYF
jgi:hypothetical protein